MKRNRRAGVEDRWYRSDGEKGSRYGVGMRWRARYVDERGTEHAKGFARKADAQAWLDKQTAALVSCTHVAPRDANVKFSHIRVIETTFGDMALADIRPSTVKTWLAAISETYAPSYVRAVYGRLSQILGDAVQRRAFAA